MRAMVIDAPYQPLRLEERALPKPGAGEILIRIRACGVCRTDLHVVDGELPQARYPVVPGHEIVGEVSELGEGVEGFAIGKRVGVPWLGWTCGGCRYCLAGQENLCDFARFTGCSLDGGYGVRIYEGATGRLVRDLQTGDANPAFSAARDRIITTTGRLTPRGAECRTWRQVMAEQALVEVLHEFRSRCVVHLPQATDD